MIADRPIAVPGIRLVLESACFDAPGNPIFSDTQGGRVMRRDPRGGIPEVAWLGRFQPGGMAVHRDGRVFIAAGNGGTGSAILAMAPERSGSETIVPERAGFAPSDLVSMRRAASVSPMPAAMPAIRMAAPVSWRQAAAHPWRSCRIWR